MTCLGTWGTHLPWGFIAPSATPDPVPKSLAEATVLSRICLSPVGCGVGRMRVFQGLGVERGWRLWLECFSLGFVSTCI